MNKKFSVLLLSSILVFSMVAFSLADPNGAGTVTPGADSSLGSTNPENHTALAGNVTELTIDGNSVTQTWQGYYGNVSGTIRLADSSGNNMYNWTSASPQGEVFASNASSISWSTIECFNWSNNGTALEAAFGIAAGDSDGVNETFKDSNSHVEFHVGSTTFSAGECMSADLYDNTGASVDGEFEEVLLQDGPNTIFASLLEEDNTGFDGGEHDFQMLVLEDGHDGDTSTTTYFFYVELE